MSINIMSKREYDKALKQIKKDGEAVTTEFSNIVLTGIALYWGEANCNIQVINNLIDTAKVFKGLRVKALIEYLSNVIPHKPSKSGDYHFTESDKKLKKQMEKTWEAWVTANPDWDKLTVEKDPAPFNLLKFVGQVQKAVLAAHEKDQMSKSDLKLFKQQMNSISW